MDNQATATPSAEKFALDGDVYRRKLFLTPAELKELLGIGENLLYEYLKAPPFRTERIGSKILIHSRAFWNWYDYGDIEGGGNEG